MRSIPSVLPRAIVTLLLAVARGASHFASAGELKQDEVIVFYPALARQVNGEWAAELHGIIYEPERERMLTAIIRKALGLDEDELTAVELATCRERIRYFLVDNERGKDLSVWIGGRATKFGASAANGHFRGTIKWGAGENPFAITNSPGLVATVEARIAATAGTERRVPLEVQLLPERGISVISDIDDTIKISEVGDRKALVRNTFCRPFKAVPGMAETYQSWAKSSGAQFHYLTANPWQLYLPPSEFTRSNGFPSGTFFMKDFRAKDSSFFQLFASPERYKSEVIERLLKEFPNRQFVLVGDSGEKDPEIYAEVARKHPRQIRKIFIREATGEPTDSARCRQAFTGLKANQWQVFKDAVEIERRLLDESETPCRTGRMAASPKLRRKQLSIP